MNVRAIAILGTLWLTLFAFAPLSASVAQVRRPLIVIVGTATEFSDISLASLRNAFVGERVEYKPGKLLVPFNLPPGSAERTLFDSKVLGLAPNEVGRFWISRRIRDEGTPPRILPSRDMAVRVVASFAGAITYVNEGESTTGVHVLTIDGKAPNDPSYLLAR
jgi:hypothetical protein